jgi:hypothetical protein
MSDKKSTEWDYNVSTCFPGFVQDDYSWLNICEKDYERLLHTNLNKRAIVTGDNSAKEQIIWDMEKPPKPEIDKNEDIKREKLPEAKSIIFDHLAWYQPLHSYQLGTYGVYLPLAGIVQCADMLSKYIPEEVSLSRRQKLFWAGQLLFLHETCHAYIERLVYAMEQFCESDQRYTKTYNDYSLILMEEALCNTFITGMHKKALENCGQDFDLLLEQFDALHQALLEFMRSQPIGYKNFIDIHNNPNAQKLFADNCKALLSHVYSIDIEYQHLGFKIIYPFGEPCDFEKSQYQNSILNDSIVPWKTPCHFVDNQQNLSGNSLYTLYMWDLKEFPKPDFMKFVIGNKRYYFLNTLSSLSELPEEINGSLICNNIGVSNLAGFPKTIAGDLYCRNNQVLGLDNIHKVINEINGNADFRGTPIQRDVLSLIMVKGLKKVYLDNAAVQEILQKWINPEHLLDCKEELINAGLGKFAKLGHAKQKLTSYSKS